MRDTPRTGETVETTRTAHESVAPPVAETAPHAQIAAAPRGWRTAEPAELEQNVTVISPRDRIRWGPIIGGLLSALTIFVLLSITGAAIGATTLNANGNVAPTTGDRIGVAAGIWTAASALIAFFIGGWIAARNAAVGGVGTGWINGMMVFLAALPLIVWLTSQGASSLFGALGTNFYDLRSLATNTYNDAAARDAAVNNAKNGLWWSLIALLAGIVAAGFGGLLGHRNPREVWRDDAAPRA